MNRPFTSPSRRRNLVRLGATFLGLAALVVGGAGPTAGPATASSKAATSSMTSMAMHSYTTASTSEPDWWVCKNGFLCVDRIWWGPDAEQQSIGVEATTGGMWYAYSDAPWLTVSPEDDGEGEPDPLWLSVEENTTNSPRSGLVYLVAGTQSIGIEVVQGPTSGWECVNSFLCLEQTWWGPDALQQTIGLEIMTGGMWSSSTSESWLSVDPEFGSDAPSELLVTVAENSTSYSRSGTVEIIAGTASIELLVVQGPMESMWGR